jgi:hypothetical protein
VWRYFEAEERRRNAAAATAADDDDVGSSSTFSALFSRPHARVSKNGRVRGGAA